MSASPKKAPITLKDIASDTELSVATVSLALRNDPSITEETRRRVLEAKRRLGYSPLRKRVSIKSLSAALSDSSGCKSILYCVAGFPVRKTQYADFLVGVMNACSQRKIRLEVKSIPPEEPLAEVDLPSENIDGVILTGDFQQDTVDFFLKFNPNLVLLGNYPFHHAHSVEIDVFGMGESTARRLVEDRHSNIVHLLRFPKNYYERQFLMGLRDGLEVHGIQLPASHILQITDLAGSIVDTAKLVCSLRPAITAVTSHAANITEACLTEIRCQQGGRKVPAGFGVGMISGERPAPGLCLLDAGSERCGWLAVEKLCQIRDNPPPFPFASVLSPAGWKDR